MSEEEKLHKKDKPTYIMIPRKFILSIVSGFLVLFILFGVTIQYINYIDRKSNQQFCGILILSNKANKANPNQTELGEQARVELDRILRSFHCK